MFLIGLKKYLIRALIVSIISFFVFEILVIIGIEFGNCLLSIIIIIIISYVLFDIVCIFFKKLKNNEHE